MLQVQNLRFSYSPEKNILKNIQFTVQEGDVLAILGESGSGKSTLLRLIYGLEDATEGSIFYRKEQVTGPKYNLVPGNPKMKFVPQEFDLLNSITVGENVGKYLSNFDLPLKKENIELALDTVNMLEYLNEFPSKLSGGQRQRVAIARALATQPELLLLDEPYSHLDQPLKMEIRKRIWNWAKATKCTVILTTHDSNDAMGFSDQVLVLKEGEMMQMDAPEDLRAQPKNSYVASLLGEFSKISSRDMKSIFEIEIPDVQSVIVYPEEVSVDEEGVEFEISAIRFRGRDYLIEAVRGEAVLLYYSKDKPTHFKVSLKLLNYRAITK